MKSFLLFSLSVYACLVGATANVGSIEQPASLGTQVKSAGPTDPTGEYRSPFDSWKVILPQSPAAPQAGRWPDFQPGPDGKDRFEGKGIGIWTIGPDGKQIVIPFPPKFHQPQGVIPWKEIVIPFPPKQVQTRPGRWRDFQPGPDGKDRFEGMRGGLRTIGPDGKEVVIPFPPTFPSQVQPQGAIPWPAWPNNYQPAPVWPIRSRDIEKPAK